MHMTLRRRKIVDVDTHVDGVSGGRRGCAIVDDA